MGVTIRNTSRVRKLTKAINRLGGRVIKVGVFGDDDAEMVKIARAHEFGAVIKPKNGKYLAVPSPLARGKRPRDFGNELTFVPTKSGGGLLVKRDPENPKARGEVYFFLMSEVKIPERSFIRRGFDRNVTRITAKINSLIDKMHANQVNPNTVLDMIGLEFAGLIQKELRDLSAPANAPLTVENKGSSNPLIDKGQLVGSIRHKIE